LLSEKLTRRSHQWLLVALSIGLAVAVALSIVFAGDAEAKKKKKQKSFTRTSAPVQQGGTGLQPTTTPVPLTGPTPYTFQPIKKPISVNNVTVSLTLAATNPDDPGLVLGLDGIDTGISLSGFDSGMPFTRTGTPINQKALAQAAKDGQLKGTVIDRDPAVPGANSLFASNSFNTSLQIKGKRKP
jgi:hypothetical protein